MPRTRFKLGRTALCMATVIALFATTGASFAPIPLRVTTKPPPSALKLHVGLFEPHWSLLVNVLEGYGTLLRQNPIATKGITAAILATAGDAIAQWRSEAPEYDGKRGASFALFGALYTGAFQHYWFQYMTSHIGDWGHALGIWGPDRVALPVEPMITNPWWKYFNLVSQLENPPFPMALAVAKVILNQGLIIPIIYMPLFLAFTGLIGGLNIEKTLARAQSLYWPLIQRNWFFWFPVQFLQFLVLPPDFQIPFWSAASLLWTIILSSIGTSLAGTEATTTSNSVEYPLELDAVNRVMDAVRLEDVEKSLESLVLGGSRHRYQDPIRHRRTGGRALGRRRRLSGHWCRRRRLVGVRSLLGSGGSGGSGRGGGPGSWGRLTNGRRCPQQQ